MMSHFSNDELLQIQTFIDRGKLELERQGLSIEVDSDLTKWVRLARRAPGATGAESTHDPSHSNIHPGNAFWVIVRETPQHWWDRSLRRKGPVIGCLCHKMVETEDILQEILTHRLFFDKKPNLDYYQVNIVASDNMPTIGGRVGFGGGFWVHPKYRGGNIANIVSRVTRALSLRHFDIDWTIILVKDTERRKQMIHHTFGFPNSISMIKGYYPPYATNLDVQMGYMHRDEIIRQIVEENGNSAPTTNPQPDLPTVELPDIQKDRRTVAVG